MLIRVTTEITRPSNTTAYSANDVIGPATGQSLLSFNVPYPLVSVVGGSVEGDSVHDSAISIYVVTSSAYAPGVDNAAMTAPVYADGYAGGFGTSALGVSRVTEGVPFAVGGASFFYAPFPVRPVSNYLYAAIQTTNGFTPTSGQRFKVSLFLDVPQNELGRL